MNKSNESEIWELFPKGGYIGSCSKIAQFDFFRSPFSVLRFISVQVVPVLCVEVLPLSNSASSKISSLFGVFQNDPGPPKYALELRGYVKYMFFSSISLFIIVRNLRSER